MQLQLLFTDIFTDIIISEKSKRQKMYYVLRDMKSRCYNPKNKRYNRYGKRGIKICKRWLSSLDNFIKDMGFPQKGLSIDRINNDGNYEPSNCRWATAKQQANNKSEPIYKNNGVRLRKSREIDFFNLLGVYVETFKSVNEIKEKFNLNNGSGVYDCINGKRKNYLGFIFKYKE